MQQSKRRVTTVQLKPSIAKAMKQKAALNDTTVAETVNALLAEQLRQDRENIRIAREREKEPLRPLGDVVADLEKHGAV